MLFPYRGQQSNTHYWNENKKAHFYKAIIVFLNFFKLKRSNSNFCFCKTQGLSQYDPDLKEMLQERYL